MDTEDTALFKKKEERPAHEVILEMIMSKVCNLNGGYVSTGPVRYRCLTGEIKTLLEVLQIKTIFVDEKQKTEALVILRKLKDNIPIVPEMKDVRDLLSEELLFSIAA